MNLENELGIPDLEIPRKPYVSVQSLTAPQERQAVFLERHSMLRGSLLASRILCPRTTNFSETRLVSALLAASA
jgi:hypothetical protein